MMRAIIIILIVALTFKSVKKKNWISNFITKAESIRIFSALSKFIDLTGNNCYKSQDKILMFFFLVFVKKSVRVSMALHSASSGINYVVCKMMGIK